MGEPTAFARCAAIIEWLPDACLSHRTAAWLRAMLPEPELFEATVPSSRYRKTPPWLRLYRRDLPADAVDHAAELPMTTAAHTVLDCLTVLPAAEADRLIDEQLLRTVDPHELSSLCETGRPGVAALRKQLRQAALRPMSEPERLFARALARRNLHLLANEPVGPFFGDFVDVRSRTVVEIDGWEFHSDRVTFCRDRRRQNWLVINGWFVLRYSAHDVLRNLDECVDEVERVVRRRRFGRGLA
ncbi:endonuclease domain-containing protein [Nocardia sp. NPDC058497]|uniref:endonuclease domain-containing protein n=1 Tax=Nocardia sp. NPDC058497 TaxID=3346529 RepID=UPI00365A8323